MKDEDAASERNVWPPDVPIVETSCLGSFDRPLSNLRCAVPVDWGRRAINRWQCRQLGPVAGNSSSGLMDGLGRQMGEGLDPVG